MKIHITNKLLYTFFASLLLISACQKSDSVKTTTSNNGNAIITNNYNTSISAAIKSYDSVSVDVDNDKINDFTVVAFNNAFGYQYGFTIQACYVHSLRDSALVCLTSKYANYSNWSTIYNVTISEFFTYAAGFSSGDVIGNNIPDFKTVSNRIGIPAAYELYGNSWDCTSSFVYYENTQDPVYNTDASVGNFFNTTSYIGFTIRKADGKHYGWIKIANSNFCLNAQVISSGYSTVPNQPITCN